MTNCEARLEYVAAYSWRASVNRRAESHRCRIARRERFLDAIVDDRFTRASPPVADDSGRDRGDRAGCKRRGNRDTEAIASSQR